MHKFASQDTKVAAQERYPKNIVAATSKKKQAIHRNNFIRFYILKNRDSASYFFQ